MIKKFLNHVFFIFLLLIASVSSSYSEILKKIEIIGNERISDDTIKVFIPFAINDDLDNQNINLILKNLYETNFFKDVNIIFENNQLNVTVIENPIIQNINYNGIKAEKIREPVLNKLKLKRRSSYNKLFLQQDKDAIILSLKNLGYYFSKVDIFVSASTTFKFDGISYLNILFKTFVSLISSLESLVFLTTCAGCILIIQFIFELLFIASIVFSNHCW